MVDFSELFDGEIEEFTKKAKVSLAADHRGTRAKNTE